MRPLTSRQTGRGPTLRQAALIIVAGYLLGAGVPFASYSVLPSLFVASNATLTTQNILANQGLFVFAIFAMLLNFVGDIVAAWGFYILLRRVNAPVSTLTAWLRVAYATIGIAVTLNLATAYRLVTRPESFTALGADQLAAQVQLAVASFNVQFAFSLMLFGLYLVALGSLMYKSGYVPKWLGAILVIDGVGWIITEAGPYLLPRADLGLLLVTSFGELILLVWLIGWGTRLPEPTAAA